MNLCVNGENQNYSDHLKTVSVLLSHLNLSEDKCIIELNEEIITKERYSSQMIKEGDRIEIVQFMGGGR